MAQQDSELYIILKRNVRVCRYENNYLRKEVVVRCPHCGDSLDQSHSHFFIQNEIPYQYECKKCSVSGILDETTMQDLDFYDNDFIALIAESKRAVRAGEVSTDYLTRKKEGRSHSISKTRIPVPKGDELELENLKYLNDRIGSSIELKDAKKLKLILNFQEFYDINLLDEVVYPDYMSGKFNEFDLNYIGFLSYDRKFITFRNRANNTKARRYDIFNIYNSTSNNRRFYTIGTELNLLNPNLTLIIAEGVIDILSVWINIYDKQDEENVVFAAVNGAGYRNVILNFLRLGFLGLDIIIYGDSDFLLKFRRTIESFKKLPIGKLQVFYNTKLDPKDKTDFGVTKDKILRKEYKV